MTYAELKSAVASESHRSDLTTEIPRFIREAEGHIRRELVALTVTDTIVEADRVADGLYTLPTGVQQIRVINNGDVDLEKIGLAQLRRLSTEVDPLWWAERGTEKIEFRGVPATDTEFDIEYIGHPAALSADADTNTLLTNHETLYLSGALFYLYKHTQDLELAQGELDTFKDVLNKLNEQFGRRHGGASTAGAYNLYGGSSTY